MAEDDEFDPEDYEGVSERNVALPRREIRRFEKDRKERDALKSELAETQRLLAFVRAGVDPEDPAAKYFIRGYEGDMDPEAIQLAAVEARAIVPKDGQVTSAEQYGHATVAALAAGASAPSAEDDISRQLNEAGKIPWREGEQAQREIMRVVEANDIKLHVTG